MSRPQTTRKKRANGVESRQRILDATVEIAGERGYEGTSIAAVSAKCGLPASSIYWHFGSKSGVLGAVMERGAQRFFAAASPGDLDQQPEPRERVRRLLEQAVASMRQNPQFLRLFIVLLLGAGGEHAQQDVVARVRAEAHRLLAMGLACAYKPWGDEDAARIADRIAEVAMALFDGLFLASEAGGTPPPDLLLDQVVTALHALAEGVRASG